jgi:hypothetical protein
MPKAGVLTLRAIAERLDCVVAFHDGEELGPRMLARSAEHTGLSPEDL